MKRLSFFSRLTLAGVFLAAAVAVGAYGLLAASLPRSAGRAEIAGLGATVTVELDRLGVPRVRADSLTDAFRAQGYLHAQNRFFQMDLARRSAAGELAALVGAAALRLDERRRPLQFRKRAATLLESLPAAQRDWLSAYAAGVNAGLADLGSRPPEYWLLRARPERWLPEDSLLVVYAFYTMLSNNEAYEAPQGVMKETLAPSVYAFLTPSTSRFDRPLVGASAQDPTGGYRPLPVPSGGAAPHLGTSPADAPSIVEPPLTGPASNQWAVAASRSASGLALLANDPHLELRLPNPFYRSELYWGGRAARGVGIPGVPGIIVGATGRLAWGVTVSYADQSDWVVVEPLPDDATRYRVPGGSEPFRIERERVDVHGAPAVTLEVRKTRWGPVLEHDWRGRPLALHAEWLEPDGLNLSMLSLLEADDVGAAERVLAQWSGPSLNWTFADADGAIGWIVNGPLPKRVGFDGSIPTSWADGQRSWSGRLAPPKRLDPPAATLYTANNRTVPSDAGVTRMWMRPLRAERIAELLAERRRFDERDFLRMQLDTRAEGYDLIRDVALEVLPAPGSDPELAGVRAAIARWDGRADLDQAGFRLLHVYYRALLQRVLSPLLAPARAADPRFVYRWPLADEPLRRLLEERPPELLPAGFADWNAFLRAVLVDAVHALDADPNRPGPAATWGEVNRLDVTHPFAGLPLLGRRLKLPAVPLPGSAISLRVAEPDRGAVFRMVVAPGRPEAGILELSGGQSGHPLSPNFADQQPAWVEGAAAPFLAGPTIDSFELVPAQAAGEAISRTTRAR